MSMHKLKILIETLSEDDAPQCELPARTRNVIKCEYTAEIEFQSTTGKHLISVCCAHMDSGFSYAYDQVMQRLGLVKSNYFAERGEVVDSSKDSAINFQRAS